MTTKNVRVGVSPAELVRAVVRGDVVQAPHVITQFTRLNTPDPTLENERDFTENAERASDAARVYSELQTPEARVLFRKLTGYSRTRLDYHVKKHKATRETIVKST